MAVPMIDLTASSPLAAKLPGKEVAAPSKLPPAGPETVSTIASLPPTLLSQKNALLNTAIDNLGEFKFKWIAKQLCLRDAAIEAAFEKHLLCEQTDVRVEGESEGESESESAEESAEESEEEPDDGEESGDDEIQDGSGTSVEGQPHQSLKRGREDNIEDLIPVKKSRMEILTSTPGKSATVIPMAVTKPKVMLARFSRCIQCEEDFDVTYKGKENCRWHSGELEPDYDGFFADHDENCHGPILGTEEEYPEGFIWDCCDKDNSEGHRSGCETGWHSTTYPSWL